DQGGDRRNRLRRAGRGGAAQGGRGRGPGAVREEHRRRRGLAGQHLSRGGLRRALPPVLAVVRAQGRLVATVRPAGRDPPVPARGGAGLRRPAPHPVRHRGARRRFRRGQRHLAADARRRGRARGRRPDHCDRAAQPAEHPGRPRPRPVRRHRLPLRAVEPRPRPHRRAVGCPRHRRQRHPVRPGHRATDRSPGGLPAVGPVRAEQARPGLSRPGHEGLRPRARVAAAQPRGQLLLQRAAVAGFQHRAATAVRPPAPLPHPPGRGGARPGPPAEAHAHRPDGLQAHPHVQRLVPGPAAAAGRGGHRRDRRGAPALDRHRRRHRARGRHHRAGHRVRRHRVPRADADHRPRRARPARAVAGRRERLPRHRRPGFSEPLRALRAEHQPRAQLDPGDARGAGGLGRAGRTCAGGRRTAVAGDPARRRRGVRLLGAGAGRAHRLRWRLPQLVPHRERPEHAELAGVDADLPAAPASAATRGLPAGPGSTGRLRRAAGGRGDAAM
ncbi:MAG: Cyclohexanone monooxygenase, partial [uncultured Blastococcus sp.]